jgi:small nuclear ribonucleoprotein (snRNP)-like protein
LVSIPAIAAGQTSDLSRAPAQTFGALAGRLESDQRLVVTTADGTQVRGRLEKVDASLLVLRTGGEVREFGENDVREVRRRGDRLWNGALFGAGAGGLGGALIGGGRPGCSGSDASFCTGLGFLLGVPIGVLAGVTVDALMPHDHLLFGRSGAQSHQWLLVPTLGDKTYAVHLVKSF